jgi:hypothetical protein
MKRLSSIVGLLMFVATSWGQVFEPIVVRTPETEKVSTVSIHGSTFERALDPSGRWTLGATLGYVSGASFSGEFEEDKPASGFTYGASLSYRVSRQFSLNVGFWTIDLTNEGGGRISRFNGGMSFHF